MDTSGIINFSNLFFVLSILMIVIPIIILFGIHFVAIISLIPLSSIEPLIYFNCIVLIYIAPQRFGNLAYIWGLLFAGGLSGASLLTINRIKDGSDDIFVIFNILNIIIYCVTGIYLNSSLICTFAILFLMNHFIWNIGTRDPNESMNSLIAISGLITGVGIIIRNICNNNLNISQFMKYAELFVPGSLWIGPLIFYISLIFMSCKFYINSIIHTNPSNSYIKNNIIAVLYMVSVMFIGNLYMIPQISSISGTMVFIYLFLKYIEIIQNRIEVHAWTFLIIGLITYFSNIYIRSYVEQYGLANYFNILPHIYNIQH